VGVLDVEIVGSGGLGAVLVGGDARHDVGGGGLLRARGGGQEQEEEGGGWTHSRQYVAGRMKFRAVLN